MTRPAGYLPQLLDADGVALRIAVFIQRETFDQLLGETAARTFGKHGDPGLDINALGVARFMRAVLGDTHVADAHASDRTVFVVDRVGGGEAWEYIHTECLGLRRQPRAQRT